MNLTELLDRPIAFHRPLVGVAGGVLPALMLSQALYWTKRTSNTEGWFWKTQADWDEETGMGRREQETARARLRQTRFWKEELQGIPAKMHFRVDLDLLAADLLGGDTCQTSMAESAILVRRKAPNKHGGKRHTGMADSAILYTETTAETTAESTQRLKASARSAVALQADDESDQPDLIDRSDQTALPLDNVMDDETPAKPGPRKKRETPALVDDSPVVITMPVVGGGEGEYPVTEAACALFRETYPFLDVGQCLREAKLWLVSNPGKRKTPGGMPRFLANWLQRAQNHGENLLVNTSRSSSRALNGTAPLVRESLSEKNRRAEETFVALMQARAQGEKKS